MNAIQERCAAVDSAVNQLVAAVSAVAELYDDTLTSDHTAEALAAGFAGVMHAAGVSLEQILSALARAGIPLELATVNALPC